MKYTVENLKSLSAGIITTRTGTFALNTALQSVGIHAVHNHLTANPDMVIPTAIGIGLLHIGLAELRAHALHRSGFASVLSSIALYDRFGKQGDKGSPNINAARRTEVVSVVFNLPGGFNPALWGATLASIQTLDMKWWIAGQTLSLATGAPFAIATDAAYLVGKETIVSIFRQVDRRLTSLAADIEKTEAIKSRYGAYDINGPR